MKKIAIISTVILVLDQVTKLFVSSFVKLDSVIEVLGSFFSITYVKNYGAAFSILNGSRFFLIATAVATLLLIYFLYLKNTKLDKYEELAFSLLIGGIMGNLIDRIIYGYVIDFFSFKIFGYYFPIFNIADIFIVLSVFLLFITMIGDKNDKLNNK